MLTDERTDMTMRTLLTITTSCLTADAPNNNHQLSNRCDKFHVPATLSPRKGSIDRTRQRWASPAVMCAVDRNVVGIEP